MLINLIQINREPGQQQKHFKIDQYEVDQNASKKTAELLDERHSPQTIAATNDQTEELKSKLNQAQTSLILNNFKGSAKKNNTIINGGTLSNTDLSSFSNNCKKFFERYELMEQGFVANFFKPDTTVEQPSTRQRNTSANYKIVDKVDEALIKADDIKGIGSIPVIKFDTGDESQIHQFLDAIFRKTTKAEGA